MGAESTFDIKIRSTADTRSIKELETELKQVTKAWHGMAADDPGFAKQAQAVAGLKERVRDLSTAQQQVQGSSRNMGNAVLQASRGMQDMQYGLAGAVNNLEGIASALGLGAGVAGAVTLVAVAAQTLGPVVVEWFKSLDTEGKKLDELKTKLREGAELILGEWTPASQAAKDEADKFTDSIKNQAEAFSTLDKAQKASLDILKQRQAVDKDIAKTKEENDIADIKAKNLPKEEEARAIAAVKLEKAKADRQRELGTLEGEQTIAGEAVGNATKDADMAAVRQKKLADEKQRSLLQATLEQEIGGTVDEKGNVLKAGSLDRIKAAEADVAGADKLRGMQGIDPAFAEQERIKARDKLKQEQQRHDDLTKESRDNIAANGGDQFRDIKTIDKELDQASGAAEAAAKKKQAAEFEKAKLDALQFEQKRKIENDYSQAQGKAVAGLPDESAPRATRDHAHDQSDPFAEATQKRAATPRRDLAAEERGAAPRPLNEKRNLVAEEMMGGKKEGRDLVAEETKKAAESNSAANEATLAALKQMQADNKKLMMQIKNSRS